MRRVGTTDVVVVEVRAVTGRAGLGLGALVETRSEVVVAELGVDTLVETGTVVEAVVEAGVTVEVTLLLSNLTLLSTTGAVILHTG